MPRADRSRPDAAAATQAPAPAAKPRTAARDVLAEAARAVVGRRVRAALTVAGIALGIAAAVATLGITSTAGGAISDRFDAVQATLVTAEFSGNQFSGEVPPPPPSASARVRALNGVVDAGLLCPGRADHALSRVGEAAAGERANQVSVVAAEPHALSALDVHVTAGRAFDAGHGARAEPVALLDRTAARALGMTHPTDNPVVHLDGEPVHVLGIFEPPRGETRLTNAVVVPYAECERVPETAIRTTLGAADPVAHEAPLALHPRNPAAVEMQVPPDLGTFRAGVETETRALFLGLAAVSLVIGALGVSNTTLVSVLERRAEIGLRRAVGASRRAVAGQFVVESVLLGLLGGVLGTVLGVDVTAAVALTQDWLLVLDPVLVAAGPAVGMVVGMVAGAYPAWSASRVAPASILRGQ